ncbi:MAG: FAD synthetase family protein [Acidimicrobiia bacterium]|nr:FAD synthetase family protein [Acidimicrobiia bacterium]
MKVLQGFAGAWAAEDAESALAVGVFDGMHSGHRSVLAAVCRHAAAGGLRPGVVTFDPHPLAVVAPDRAPAMITDIDQRLELLEGLGMELVAVVAFDEVTRAWSPSDFALGLLAGTLRARVVLAGEDFRFAKDRVGDVGVLRELGAIGGFETEVVPLVGGAARPASSSAVRALIAAGDVAAAADELERPHEVRGVAAVREGVVAIAVPPAMAMPPAGAYAGNVGRSSTERIPALIRIGDGLSVEPLAPGAVRSGSIRVRFVARLPEGSGDIAAAVRSLVVPPGS